MESLRKSKSSVSNIKNFSETYNFKKEWAHKLLSGVEFLNQSLLDWVSYFQTQQGQEYYKELSSDSKKSLGFLFSLGVENGIFRDTIFKRLGISLPTSWIGLSPEKIDKTVTALAFRLSYDENIITALNNYLSKGLHSFFDTWEKKQAKDTYKGYNPNKKKTSAIGKIIKKRLHAH